MTTPQTPRFTMPTYQQLVQATAEGRNLVATYSNPFARPTNRAIQEMMEKTGCDRETAIDFLRERD